MNDNDNALDTKPADIPLPSESASVKVSPETIVPAKVTTEEALPTFDITSSQESTRARIALLFTQIFLLLVGACILLPFIVNLIDPNLFQNPLDISKSLVTTMASVLAGPVGFIVGFYFKQTISGK